MGRLDVPLLGRCSLDVSVGRHYKSHWLTRISVAHRLALPYSPQLVAAYAWRFYSRRRLWLLRRSQPRRLCPHLLPRPRNSAADPRRARCCLLGASPQVRRSRQHRDQVLGQAMAAVEARHSKACTIGREGCSHPSSDLCIRHARQRTWSGNGVERIVADVLTRVLYLISHTFRLATYTS